MHFLCTQTDIKAKKSSDASRLIVFSCFALRCIGSYYMTYLLYLCMHNFFSKLLPIRFCVAESKCDCILKNPPHCSRKFRKKMQLKFSVSLSVSILNIAHLDSITIKLSCREV